VTTPPGPARRPRRRNGAIWAAGILAGVGAGVVAERLYMRREAGRPDPERGQDFATLPGEEVEVRSFDGARLHCRVVGPSDGPTLVFAHGITLNLTTWYYQWRAFSDRYRCVLYDQRGHGRSDASLGDDYSIEVLGEDLRAVLDTTCPDGPAVVLGHSMGGMTIVSLADRHPREFAGRVVGAVLVDTTVSDLVREAVGSMGARVERILRPASRWYTSDLARVERVRRRIRRTGTDFAYAMTRLTNFGPNASPAQVDHVGRVATEASPEVWARTLRSLIEMDLRHAVRHVTVPTLVLVGDHDRLTPKTSAQALLRELPHGRGFVLSGAGHLAMMERHEAFNRLVEPFLAEVLPVPVAQPRRRRRGAAAR
jgi:pimeloyl-ACP methyl ester carboxylesterase